MVEAPKPQSASKSEQSPASKSEKSTDAGSKNPESKIQAKIAELQNEHLLAALDDYIKGRSKIKEDIVAKLNIRSETEFRVFLTGYRTLRGRFNPDKTSTDEEHEKETTVLLCYTLACKRVGNAKGVLEYMKNDKVLELSADDAINYFRKLANTRKDATA